MPMYLQDIKSFLMKTLIFSVILIVLATSLNNPKYTLSFRYAARSGKPLATSQMQVVWDNAIIRTIEPLDYQVGTSVISLTITPGTKVLSFIGTGPSDSFGITVSSVSLIQKGTTNNLVVNGDLSQPNTNGGWRAYTNIPGWTGQRIQIGQGTIYNPGWAGQGQVVELDSNHNDMIQQTFNFNSSFDLIPNVDPVVCSNTATRTYNLQFDWAPRTVNTKNLTTSQANVWFNSILVTSLLATESTNGVNHFSGNVAFSACTNVLSFDGTGRGDAKGISIANVKLFAPSSTTNLIVNGDFASPDVDNTYRYINGGIPGWAATKAQIGNRKLYNSAWPAGQAIQLDVETNTRYTQTIPGFNP